MTNRSPKSGQRTAICHFSFVIFFLCALSVSAVRSVLVAAGSLFVHRWFHSYSSFRTISHNLWPRCLTPTFYFYPNCATATCSAINAGIIARYASRFRNAAGSVRDRRAPRGGRNGRGLSRDRHAPGAQRCPQDIAGRLGARLGAEAAVREGGQDCRRSESPPHLRAL